VTTLVAIGSLYLLYGIVAVSWARFVWHLYHPEDHASTTLDQAPARRAEDGEPRG
jgi:hypothetical protein